mgnify:CR=1 FL=1
MTLAEALSVRINQLMQERNLTQYKLAQTIAQGLEIDLTEFFNSPLFSRENITD